MTIRRGVAHSPRSGVQALLCIHTTTEHSNPRVGADATRITHHASRITHHASLRSVNHTLDDEIAVLVLALFSDLERLERVLELERVREERL
jgi:hypothetical protein